MKSEECACHLSRLTALLCEQAEKPLQYIQVFDLNSQLQLGQYADKLKVDAVPFEMVSRLRLIVRLGYHY